MVNINDKFGTNFIMEGHSPLRLSPRSAASPDLDLTIHCPPLWGQIVSLHRSQESFSH